MQEGRFGACLDVYPLVRASRYLGCRPWELAEQPTYWRDAALKLEAADIAAEIEAKKRRAAINQG